MQHAHLYVESLQTDNLNKKYQTHEFEVNESKEEEAEAESPFWAFLKLFFRNLLENFFNSRNPSILDFF